MATSERKRPRDPNQLAKLISDLTTGEVEKTPDPRDPKAVSRGRLGGLKGGAARKDALTDAQRKEIAQKAAKARWEKK